MPRTRSGGKGNGGGGRGGKPPRCGLFLPLPLNVRLTHTSRSIALTLISKLSNPSTLTLSPLPQTMDAHGVSWCSRFGGLDAADLGHALGVGLDGRLAELTSRDALLEHDVELVVRPALRGLVGAHGCLCEGAHLHLGQAEVGPNGHDAGEGTVDKVGLGANIPAG
jgi:hypothetical protein